MKNKNSVKLLLKIIVVNCLVFRPVSSHAQLVIWNICKPRVINEERIPAVKSNPTDFWKRVRISNRVSVNGIGAFPKLSFKFIRICAESDCVVEPTHSINSLCRQCKYSHSLIQIKTSFPPSRGMACWSCGFWSPRHCAARLHVQHRSYNNYNTDRHIYNGYARRCSRRHFRKNSANPRDLHFFFAPETQLYIVNTYAIPRPAYNIYKKYL